jgi:signal transduction histidine kinase
MVEIILRPEVPWRWLTLVIALMFAAALPWRRVHPLPVTVAFFGFGPLDSARVMIRDERPIGLSSMTILLVFLYALCRWGSGRDVVVGVSVALFTATLAMIVDTLGWSDVVGGYAFIAAVIAAGLAVRFRATAHSRALDQARSIERERFARDLHDTVAHHVTAISISAQAGTAATPSRLNAALEALRMIETEAALTLTELRTMVGTLRGQNDAAELAPTPTVFDINDLSSAPSDHPQVTVSIDGSLSDVAPAVATALYRVAQESVTNARRHAKHAGIVTIEVKGIDSEIELRVTDDGARVVTNRQPGFGVVGMTERVSLLGGTLSAGPLLERGWSVVARLPRSGAKRVAK